MEALEALIVLAMAVGIPFLIAMYLMPKEKNTDYKELYLELKTKYDNLSKKDGGQKAFKDLYSNHVQLSADYVALQKHCSKLEEKLKTVCDELQTAKQNQVTSSDRANIPKHSDREYESVKTNYENSVIREKKISEKLSTLQKEFDNKVIELHDANKRAKDAEESIPVLLNEYNTNLERLNHLVFGSDAHSSILTKYFSDSLIYSHVTVQPEDEHDRFWKFALDESSALSHKILGMDITAKVLSADNTIYFTSLSRCTCKDFTFNLKSKKPCKHMYLLAYELARIDDIPFEKIVSEYRRIAVEVQSIDHKRKLLENEMKAVNSKKQSFPYIAKIISDYYADLCLMDSDEMRNKKSPALKAADKLSIYAQQIKKWSRRAKLAEHRLTFLENVFPWLVEFEEAPPAVACTTVQKIDKSDTGYQHYQNWLSAIEYENLTPAERNQLSLDRYKKRHKSSWEAGIDYERFVGYQYEMQGFKVSYVGATRGLEDMGRDLVAKKHGITYIVQCKRWYEEKTIHENHIFQLYGTTILYKMDHPKENVKSLFITTADFSETAKQVADFLSIQLITHHALKEYPLIKCNIGKDGNKIYHMPFDQQYDTIIISPDRGEQYVSTANEAESLGYRHAYRWHS